jgi:hypothetical protein
MTRTREEWEKEKAYLLKKVGMTKFYYTGRKPRKRSPE